MCRVLRVFFFRIRLGNSSLFPPLHDLGTHFYEASFSFAVGEAGYRFNSLIDVFLCESAGLFESRTACYNVASLQIILVVGFSRDSLKL
jgi:hypothetical protein